MYKDITNKTNPSLLQQRLLIYEPSKDCIERHRRPSASYNVIVLNTLVIEEFHHYTYEYIVYTSLVLY